MSYVRRIGELARSPTRIPAALKRWIARLPAYRRLANALFQLYLRMSIHHVAGPRRVAIAQNELVVVCMLRDGIYYVNSFLEHYFRLGAKHIVFLDNGSIDGTIEQLHGRPGVTVLRSKLSFKRYQHDMRKYLIRHFGAGHWCLYVDIDELFDYPCSDQLPLSDFLRYLTARGYTSVVGQMVDMFSDQPISRLSSRPGDSLKQRYRFYDPTDLECEDYGRHYGRAHNNQVANPDIPILIGGIRGSVFGVRAWMTKHPLMFIDRRIAPMIDSSHTVANARIADISCALLHYKFLGNFAEVVERGVREEGYYRGSEQYKQYKEILKNAGDLSLKRATARELHSLDDLVRGQILNVTPEYLEWVRLHAVAAL